MASHLLAARRRRIRRHGRPAELRRLARGSTTVSHSVTLLAAPHGFSADQMAAGVRQGDQQLETLDDEMQAARWPGRPKAPDKVVFDGLEWTVVDATPVHDGALRIGWRIWIRGGA